MNAYVASFYAAPVHRDQPATPSAEKGRDFLSRFVKHMFSGGAPVWHVATMGAVMRQTNGAKQ